MTLVIYAYLDELKIHLSYQKAVCPGIFVDPCTAQIIKGDDSIKIQHFPLTHANHAVRNHVLVEHSDKGMNSPMKFMTFTLQSSKSYASIQVMTPQWQYQKHDAKFKYHCKLVLFQDHARRHDMLYYEIKSFQFENIMVFPHNGYPDKIYKYYQCNSALSNSVSERELPGFGDMLTYYFQEAHVKEHKVRLIGQWCGWLCDALFYCRM